MIRCAKSGLAYQFTIEERLYMSQIMKKPEVTSGSWWKYGYVWLVLAGPAIVVVAAIITAMIAIRGADPVVEEDYYQKGMNINQELRTNKSLAPAGAARNHVVTPDADLPDLSPK